MVGPRRGAVVAAAALVAVVGAGTARASGSASVVVVNRHLSLEIRQTFRKILSSRQMRGYFERERQAFLAQARAIVPRLTQVVRRFRRRVRALRAVSSNLPVVRCVRHQRCPAAVKRYPALVALPRLSRRKGSRTAYIVSVGLRRAPSKRQVKRLVAALQRALDKEPGSAEKGASYGLVSQLDHAGKRIAAWFRPRYFTADAAAEQARLRKRLAFVVKRVARRLDKIARANGCAVTAYRRTLPYYERNKPNKLPARDTVTFGTALIGGAIQIGLAKVPDKDKYDALVTALSKTAQAALRAAP